MNAEHTIRTNAAGLAAADAVALLAELEAARRVVAAAGLVLAAWPHSPDDDALDQAIGDDLFEAMREYENLDPRTCPTVDMTGAEADAITGDA